MTSIIAVVCGNQFPINLHRVYVRSLPIYDMDEKVLFVRANEARTDEVQTDDALTGWI